MTGREVADLRRTAGLGVVAFGRALGYRGSTATVSRMIRRAEAQDCEAINQRLADRVQAFAGLLTAAAGRHKVRESE